MDEADNLARAIAGDADALAALLEHHAPAVRRRLEPEIPGRFAGVLSADDVMQQTYVDAYRDVGTFETRGEGDFAAWLHALARRNLLDALRMLKAQKRGGEHRRVERSRDDSCRALIEMIAASDATPSRIAAGREALVHLERAIAALPSAYHTVVEQYDLQGRCVEDVARQLDRSAGAVYMMRSRAHRLLAEMLGGSSRFFSETA